MSSTAFKDLRETLASIASTCSNLSEPLASAIAAQGVRLVAAYRAEVHRTVAALALGLATVFFTCMAVALAMFCILLTLWDTHRVLGAVIAAILCALLALVAALWMHTLRRAHLRRFTA
ncbi:MAG TPA: hypothetical protein VLW26_12340 [Steroidobacteraceae bacterium]|nr:hypothetical protein [Steroidobacteraceae bacterium]